MRAREQILITGSSGFLGYHVLSSLAALGCPAEQVRCIDLVEPAFETPYSTEIADVRDRTSLKRIARAFAAEAVIHLAAEAEVVTAWPRVADLLSTNHEGTYNICQIFQPRTLIFPSTCSVYGNAERGQALPMWSSIAPLSLYGISKATGEMICRDWTRACGTAAVVLRFANLVGRRCRGLLPYLASHVQSYPDGSVKAQMRGYGRLVRDYVPVDFAVRVVVAAAAADWAPGVHIYNVSVGRGTSNREIADIVRRAVAPHGYRLEVEWTEPAALGEAESIVLEPEATTRRFGFEPPDARCVEACIQDSVLHHLGLERHV